MKRTTIHTTKKLEKLIQKLILPDQITDCGILGKWNATVFYIDRKKCWLVTNALTKYNVILIDIKATKLSKIEQIFKDALLDQLIYDGVKIDFKTLDASIGELDFRRSDNDRSTIGFQNQRLEQLSWWKRDFDSLKQMPMHDLTHRMNTSPIHIGEGRKMSDYTNSVVEINKFLMA